MHHHLSFELASLLCLLASVHAQGGVAPGMGGVSGVSNNPPVETTVLGPTVLPVSGTSTVPVVSVTTATSGGTTDASGSTVPVVVTPITSTVGSTAVSSGGNTTALLIVSDGTTTITASTGAAVPDFRAGPAEAWGAAAVGALAAVLGML